MPLDSEQMRNKLEGYPDEVVNSLDAFVREGDVEAFETGLLYALGFLSQSGDAKTVAAASGSARLREDLGIDSLAVAELVFLIEDAFGVAIQDEELEALKTVGDFRRLAKEKVAARLT
jgi:acyl carrier protein